MPTYTYTVAARALLERKLASLKEAEAVQSALRPGSVTREKGETRGVRNICRPASLQDSWAVLPTAARWCLAGEMETREGCRRRRKR